MKIKSIKNHLQPYSILGKRQTTINHAFASAIASLEVNNRYFILSNFHQFFVCVIKYWNDLRLSKK